MLQQAPMYAYIPAKDLARARKFYEEKVGLKPKEENAGGVTYQFGKDTACFLYPTPNAGTSKASQAGRYRHRRRRQGGVVQGQRGQHPRPGAAALRRNLEDPALALQSGVLVFLDGNDAITVKDEAHHGADLVPERTHYDPKQQKRRRGECRGDQQRKEPALRHLPPPEKRCGVVGESPPGSPGRQ